MNSPLDWIEAACARARDLTSTDAQFMLMLGIGAVMVAGYRGDVRRTRLVSFKEIREASADPLTPAVNDIRRELMMAAN
jgi:hypothetical protein